MSTRRQITVMLLILLVYSTSIAQDATPTALPAFPISPGVPIEGNINNTTVSARFSFDAESGDAVEVRMDTTSGDLDPFLQLFAPDGTLLDSNDDIAQGNRNARIGFSAPVTGTYQIEATRFEQSTGTSNGTYRISLTIEGADIPVEDESTLRTSPPFSVAFTQLAYEEFGAGTLSEAEPRRYFAVGGQQGDIVRALLTVTSGDLVPSIQILTEDSSEISETLQPRDNERIAFTTLPRTGWYLVEVQRQSGDGNFGIFIDGIEGQVLAYNEPPVVGELAPNVPTLSYTFDARINDQIFASLFTIRGQIAPEIRLLDIGFREIAAVSGERSATLRATIPRSGPYILQVNNTQPNTNGSFNLRLTGVPVQIEAIETIEAAYNNAYKGEISNENPLDYYRFTGKADDLITVRMEAADPNLDPFLILTDSDLNELAANDNFANTRNARIAQFALPADGDYLLLAGRSGLSMGVTGGEYDLALNVGAISLVDGRLSATVSWSTDDDLNLFLREPSGRIISWSNPAPDDGPVLQIDSNTNCDTISTQPVEHIYVPEVSEIPDGDYQLWVWYQSVCERETPVGFDLNLQTNDGSILDAADTLLPGQRFNVDLRLSGDQVFILDEGRITRPSPQQRASEGGDILLLFDQSATGTISDEVYALFYQFTGEEGTSIELEVTTLTGNLDPVLVLRDQSDNNLVVSDDISSDNRNGRIEFMLPYTGRYTVAVTRFGVREGTTRGDFRLTLQTTE